MHRCPLRAPGNYRGKSVFSVDGAQNTCGSAPGEAPCLFFICRKDAAEAFALSEHFQLEVSAMLNKRVWGKMPPPSQVTPIAAAASGGF